MDNLDVYLKFTSLPEELRKEAEHFLDFLQSKVEASGTKPPRRKAGLAKGLIRMKEDFDEPLEDFKDYME